LYLDDAEGGGFRVTGTKRRISAALTMLRDGGDKSAAMNQYKSSATLETAALEAISVKHRAWWGEWSAVWATAWSAAIAELAARGHVAIEAWCADLDVSWTIAKLAREWLWKRPVFVTDAPEAFVEVSGLRHPILERIQTGGVPYVSHAVTLGPPETNNPSSVQSDSGLLLYGMNASGKSSLMKALGLCVLLAQCGMPVPASACRLAPFSAIFTRILGNDNLWAGLSSFAVEMTEFREILQFADERTLVLGDELCSGTESLSATALVAAGVEVLVGRGTKFVFATHLHELATLPDIAGLRGVKAVHLKVHYDATADRLVYDRHLAPGSGSALYGLSKSVGLWTCRRVIWTAPRLFARRWRAGRRPRCHPTQQRPWWTVVPFVEPKARRLLWKPITSALRRTVQQRVMTVPTWMERAISSVYVPRVTMTTTPTGW